MNNQENSNEVSKAKNDLQKLVAEILLHKTMLSGTKIREVSELISQSVELNYKSIDEPITDKEIDAEIERYIKQFWPRPEHGGAVRLGFKRAVRWMQERGAKSDFLHVLQENYEATKRMSEMQIALTTKYALLETYEDLIAIYKSNYTEATKPINNDPLREKFRSVIIEEYGNLILNSLVKKCVQVAEQYAASKLNNTIKDKWISVGDRLPEEGGRYWCYVEHQTDLGLSHFQWNCSYNEISKTFSDRYLTDGERVTHWQPLPKAPNQ